jgi:cAMP phosphodiesterase
VKFQLLPSTFDENGCASARQHLACFVIDNCVAIDAGSLAMATTSEQKELIRDVVLTHAHLDHIAGLPLFVDDLFATLKEPIRVYGSAEVIECLHKHIFNWEIYPRFSELTNENGKVLEYRKFKVGKSFEIKHLKLRAIEVNHKVPTVGFIVSDGSSSIALTSDTSKMSGFWNKINREEKLDAVFIECAFPNELKKLAKISHHLTPDSLKKEIEKLEKDCPIYVVNLKPMYHDEIVLELKELNIKNLQVLEVGKIYDL